MHSFKPLALVRIDPLDVELSQLEDPYFIPLPSQLTIDMEPGLYIYEMHFNDVNATPVRLRGVVGKLSLGDHGHLDSNELIDPELADDPRHEHLLAHEMTLSSFKESSHDQHDAWGPVWLLSDDPVFSSLEAFQGQLVARVTDSRGVHHRMYQIIESGFIQLISDAVSDARLVVADGHHRIRNAIEGLSSHREDDRNGAPEFITYISALHDASLLIHPIHRALHLGRSPLDVLGVLEERLVLRGLDETAELTDDLEFPILFTARGVHAVVGMRQDDGTILSSTDPSFRAHVADAELLSALLKDQPSEIFYRFVGEEIRDLVNSGRADVGLVCRSVTTERILHAATSHDLLPPKSTLFNPKPLAALMLQEASGEGEF
jgi:uncharacterized protein (DUF1015 family)